jgi:hypothetical protein
MIPSEIGLLSDSLSKFIIEERNNDDAFRLVAKFVAIFHLVINLIVSCCFVNFSTETIWLDTNSLESTIPTEIGQLKVLGNSDDSFCPFVQIIWIFPTII